MAIFLAKNKAPQLIYNSRDKKRMKHFLFMTIFMIVCTSLFMFLGFYLLPVNLFNLVFISMMTTTGYIGAFLFYNNYLTIKKKKDAGNF
jgi:ABC-type bacteriocin/lantibiotic exporter with double-glycine peptidase domain